MKKNKMHMTKAELIEENTSLWSDMKSMKAEANMMIDSLHEYEANAQIDRSRIETSEANYASVGQCLSKKLLEINDLKKTAAEATDLAADFNRELNEIDAENDRLKIRVRSLLDFIDTFRESE